MLACASYNHRNNRFISTWDLQTGALASSVELPLRDQVGSPEGDYYITYSTNGKMIGILHRDSVTATISIVDVVSGVHTHDIYPGTPWTYGIWAHRESLRFATTKGTTIAIWEVGFTQGATRMEIESLSVSDDTDQAGAFDQRTTQHDRRTQFIPIPGQLAFTRASLAPADEFLLWGARNSTPPLYQMSASWYPTMTFSSDGRILAYSTTDLEVHLWKKSPTGYALVGKLQSDTRCSIPLLSPNGESIIRFRDCTIQLWHTKAFTTLSSSLAHVPRFAEGFVLEFVPDGQLAVVARQEEKTVTVLDLKSGLPQLTIDTSMKVYGLRVAGNTVVVIGDGVIITWDLPEANSFPHARVGVENSIQTTSFGGGGQGDVIAASISLDFRYVAVLRMGRPMASFPDLHVYCPSTGRHDYATLTSGTSLWFAPGGLDIWSAGKGKAGSHAIGQSDLRCTVAGSDIECGPSGSPWRSSRGYKVINDGWLVDPDGKRLFLLPPPWRSCPERRVWNGKFLALLHRELPQPVILELVP